MIIDIYGSELQQKWSDNKYQTTFSKLGFRTFSIDQNKYDFVNDYFKNSYKLMRNLKIVSI